MTHRYDNAAYWLHERLHRTITGITAAVCSGKEATEAKTHENGALFCALIRYSLKISVLLLSCDDLTASFLSHVPAANTAELS